MFHIEPNNLKAYFSRCFGEPRFGNTVHPRHANEPAMAQFSSPSYVGHSVLSSFGARVFSELSILKVKPGGYATTTTAAFGI